MLNKIINLGFPSAMQMLFEVVLFTAAIWLSGCIGKTSQAANQIALSLASMTFMVAMGLSVVSMIRMSSLKGKKDYKQLIIVARSLFLLTLISINVYSQIDYPKYEVDSLGQKVIVMTIEQAQSLDNNSEMLSLFEKLNSQIGSYDSVCVKVINDKDVVISSQKLQISKLKESLNNKDEQITTLQSEIKQHEVKEKILQDQVDNRQEVIGEKDKQIKKMKLKMILGGGVGAAIIGGLLFIILLVP
jgi:predicted phage tail protein